MFGITLLTPLLLALSVAAQAPSSTQGPVTMMWGDSSPASSSNPAGTTLSAQTTAAASMGDMAMGDMSMATATTKPVSALSEVSGMGGMSMETASSTAMAGMEMGGASGLGVSGMGVAMGVLGVAVLVV